MFQHGVVALLGFGRGYVSDGARELAVKFADRFPEIVKSGLGRDWAYSGWLVELIGAIERFPNRIPVLLSEYSKEEPHEMRSLPLELKIQPSPRT